jgi:hypothetical protein
LAQSSFKEKYLSVDAFLLAVGIAIVASALYFFAKDDGLGHVRFEKSTPVGSFATSRNDVRRRTRSGFTWASTAAKDAVYEGDSIFTGESSDASIQLESGSRIDIDPKSLVVIRTSGRGLQLDLQYGSLVGKVQGATPLVVSQNGQLQEISAQNAEVRIESVGPAGSISSSADGTGSAQELRIRVVKGQVSMRRLTASAKPQDSVGVGVAPLPPSAPQFIGENEVARITKENSPVVIEKDSVEPLSPPSGAVLWLTPGQVTELRWKGTASLARARVEFATDPGFTSPLASLDANGTSLKLAPEKRPNGTFHWRVVADPASKDKLQPSRASKLTLYPDEPPLPVFPSEAQEFAYNTQAGENGKQVLLSWDDKVGSTEFELQLAQDEAFNKIAMTKKLASSNEHTQMLPAGAYFWRVKGTNPARKDPPWSRTMKFSIGEELKAPEAPVLATTELDYEIPLSILAKVPPGASLDGRGVAPAGVRSFQWNDSKLAESYEVELSSSDQFTNSIKFPLGKETKFAPSEVKPGALSVRVRAKGKTGLLSAPSLPGHLRIALPAPELAPVKSQLSTFATQQELEKGKHAFALSWSKLPYASTYEVNWGADRDFTKSKKFKLKETSRTIQVTQAATYSARVRAIGFDGEPMSAYSETQTASFKKELLTAVVPIAKKIAPPVPVAAAPPALPTGARKPSSTTGMPAPVLLEPLRRTSFVSLDDSVPFVNLKWKKVARAVRYEIEISEDADFTKTIDRFQTTMSQFTVKANLPEGRVFWRVRAYGKKAKLQSDWSSVYDITVLYQ